MKAGLPAWRPQLVFEVTDLADFCGVDAATIYTWVSKGEISFFKSPGGRFRFERASVVDFLRRFQFPVPPELATGRPRVIAMDPDRTSLAQVRRTLGAAFDIDTFADAYDALLAIGDSAPDAVIMEATMPALDGPHFIRRIRAQDRLRHVRVILFAARDSERQACVDAGASAFVLKPSVDELYTSVRRALGQR